MDPHLSVQIAEGTEVADRPKDADGIGAQAYTKGRETRSAIFRHPAKRLGTDQCGAVEANGLHLQTLQNPLARVSNLRKLLPAVPLRLQKGVHRLQGVDAGRDSLEAPFAWTRGVALGSRSLGGHARGCRLSRIRYQ
jgi:hypothetical protein